MTHEAAPDDAILIPGGIAPFLSVPELVRAKAREHGDCHFLQIDGRDFTYRQLDDTTDAVAGNFVRLGYGSGSCIASLLPNCPAQLLGWIGAGKAGALWSPLNSSLVGEDLAHSLRLSGARLLLTDASGVSRLAALGDAVPDRLRIIDVDTSEFTALETPQGKPPAVDNRPGDPAAILYTGGTTGLPKGVVLPHFALVAAGYRYGQALGVTAADRHYSTLPLFHAGGIQLGIVGPLLNDMTAVMDRTFSASGYWKRVREIGATVIDPISTMMSVLVLQPPGPGDRDHRVRITTGVNAQIPPAVPAAFTRRFGVAIVDIYGASEIGGAMATSNRPGSAVPGSVGRPHGWSEVAVVDGGDNRLPSGMQGNIVLRPTVPHTFMLGYHGDAEATCRAWRNLWFHTGDLGYLDEDGNLFFVGREAHWLRRRGENISAYEVEAALTRHPAVREAIVTGAPSELGEDEVKAWIVPEGEPPDAIDLVRWCVRSLAPFKVPRFIAFVDDFPRSASKREVERAKVRSWPSAGQWDRDEVLGRDFMNLPATRGTG